MRNDSPGFIRRSWRAMGRPSARHSVLAVWWWAFSASSKRMGLAAQEWERMKASGSRECRNCHDFHAMSGDIQKQSIYKKHMAGQKAGKTCIDCHKGIAHHPPKEYKDEDE